MALAVAAKLIAAVSTRSPGHAGGEKSEVEGGGSGAQGDRVSCACEFLDRRLKLLNERTYGQLIPANSFPDILELAPAEARHAIGNER
jgi:hypothetical protein